MDQKLILVTLLIRLGVAAAISSVLVRARRFRVLLFREERTLSEKIEIVFIVGTPIALGVLARHWVHNFYAADIAFVGAILMGVIGGRLVGTAGGILVALPSLFWGEWLALPMYVLAGCAAGLLRHIAPEREAIWSFSPLFDLSIYHWIRRSIRKSFIDWQTSFFFLILVPGVRSHPAVPGVAAAHLRAVLAEHLGEARHLRGHGDGGGHRAEGAEQRAHRDEAGAAGASVAAGAHGSAAEPDQSRTSCSTR